MKARNAKQRIKAGDTFGRLTVEGFGSLAKSGNQKYLCRCSCGNHCEVLGARLCSGETKSCGCLSREMSAQRMTQHGKSGTPLWKLWVGIKNRCDNKNEPSYPRYGGRGIGYCSEWADFQNFERDLKALGPRPAGSTLDRIDNNLPYAPDNVRWATPKQQARNTRNNKLLTHNGETLCIAEWAERLGLGRTTIADRIRYGWSIERALSTPKLK